MKRATTKQYRDVGHHAIQVGVYKSLFTFIKYIAAPPTRTFWQKMRPLVI